LLEIQTDAYGNMNYMKEENWAPKNMKEENWAPDNMKMEYWAPT
jgi:hypothetical protein